MASHVRSSKFRHVYGKEVQAAERYRDIRHGSLSVDAIPLKANGKFFAVPYKTTGSICVVSFDQKGALDHESLKVIVEPDNSAVLDFEFNPFHSNILCSIHQNGQANIWKIPEDGKLSSDISSAELTFKGHEVRCLQVKHHPFAENVMTTIDSRKVGKIWDANSGKEFFTLPAEHKGLVTSVDWNGDGSLLTTYAKDKKFRIFDPRSNKCVSTTAAHTGVKAAKATWLKSLDRILTTGHSRQMQREMFYWDPRKLSDSGQLYKENLGSNSSSIIPIFDDDTHLLFLAGKGEGNIQIYEASSDRVHAVSDYKSSDPATGITALPKLSCDVMSCELARLVKLTPNNHVIPIQFFLPRSSSQFFQEDLYPDTWDGKSSLSSDEWVGGESKGANKISLEPKD